MRIRSLAFLVAFTAIGSPALASSIVVPNGAATTVGNDTDSISPSDPDVRFQQLYGNGQFLSSITGPILIDQFAFRVAPGTGALNVSFDNVDLHMSTSARFPNTSGPLMSTTFADNVGPDNSLVYHGPVSFSSSGCPVNGTTPCAFDVIVTLQHPFLYNPNQGRLLLDFSISGIHAQETGFFDSEDFSGFPGGFGSIASVSAPIGDTSGNLSPSGDITQFRYTAVPEPATMTLLLVGLGAAAAALRRRVS
jgi:hypothetical protein